MNNIGIGIFCFGEEYYFKGTVEKIRNFLRKGFKCYILTDNPTYFSEFNVIVYEYDKEFKSYYDKVLLSKLILQLHDISILIDADLYIKDYSFLKILNEYEFKEGISYPFTLESHKSNLKYIKDFPLDSYEWSDYTTYCEKILPNFGNFRTIWENILIINKKGFNNMFYHVYNELQMVKEELDLSLNKDILGNGEGISISISANYLDIPIEQDIELYSILKESVIDVSRKFTRPEFWPDFMK